MADDMDKKAAKYRQEAKQQTSTDGIAPSPQTLQEVADAKMQAKEAKAPTTKTGMSKPFKKGGKVRGGGCEQRGKTRGRMV